MTTPISLAPGWPGIEPRWTSSAKSGIGTALNRESRVWFTLSHGILNEIYFPHVDEACTRDLGLMVTDGRDFFSEEKRDANHDVACLAAGVPAYRLVNTCTRSRYRIEKEILTDPARPVLLQRTRFVALQGMASDYHVYVLLAPHLANHGRGNTGWVGEHAGLPMLFAQRDGRALALACSSGWRARSVGFVGVSDGWQDVNAHKRMTWQYDRAENGNIALTGEVNVAGADGEFILALGLGDTPAEAAECAAESLRDGFEAARTRYVREWREWLPAPALDAAPPPSRDVSAMSAIVLRTCESKENLGGIVASLSLPWGFAKSDDDMGGYHLVWPRDLAETAGALLAIGAIDDVQRVLSYLQATQCDDGHWPQNMWIDGAPYWDGIQLDETAFPILLMDLARRNDALPAADVQKFWPMLRRAAVYLVTQGPVTQQDRWEEDPGYSPFTLAAVIAALLAAADFADGQGDATLATYLRETADCWNDSIERWTYVSGTDLARRTGVDGYYVRIAPPEVAESASPASGFVPIKNRPPGETSEAASHIISPDALALVRFGLRAADDPRIVNTVKVIDALLKIDLPGGPSWHRYNDDGYGEHADGEPFDGTGIGRAWPLLTGERAHYELAAGRPEAATRLLHAMEAFANEGGLISEQVWESADIPERELFLGRPSGSAMPLVWAHAEYLKLRRSLQDGAVFDVAPQAQQRYLREKKTSPFTIWRFSHKCRELPAGRTLRVETMSPATIHWSADNWKTTHDVTTRDTGAGIHVADLPTAPLGAGTELLFTLFWPQAKRWEGVDFTMKVVATSSSR